MRKVILTVMSASALGLGLLATAPARASTATITISGSVSCARFINGVGLVGVWVNSTGGGSGWASWSGNTSSLSSSYSRTFSTNIPTRVSLHVGCGGSKSSWATDNWTPVTPYLYQKAGGIVGNAKVSAVDCGPHPIGWVCSFRNAYAAQQWAWNALHNTLYSNSCNVQPWPMAGYSWKGYCLALVNDSYYYGLKPYYGGNGQWPNPTVFTDAYHEYLCYSGKLNGTGNCPATSAVGKWTWWHKNSSGTVINDPAPPRGALVFYPGIDHVAISTGGGNVVSADKSQVAPGSSTSTGCYLHQVNYLNSAWSAYYAGWAFPSNAAP
jgi:hypothetical protein